jgi:hypothetical protein
MTKPFLFEERLSEDSITALRSVLGETIYRIYSPTLEVYGKTIIATSLSLHHEGIGYVVLENAWLETPTEYIDYWQMSARLSKKPKDIKTRVGKNGAGDTLYFPISTIQLPYPASPIEKITVHESKWSHEENLESIAYDHALVFYLKEGNRFCISAYPTNQDSLEYTEDENEINLITKEHKLRFEIS